LQSLEGDEEGTRIDAENASTYLFDADRDAVSVDRFGRQRFQNEHVESALHNIARLFGHKRTPPEDQEENTLLLLSVKKRNPVRGQCIHQPQEEGCQMSWAAL